MSALLWYETFVQELDIQGFLLNPYDPCVAKKVIEGNQCTICWYVDDTKISHKNPKVVTGIISLLESRFGEMIVKRGNLHTFVGMDFEVTDDRCIKILVDDYIKECIDTFEEIDKKISGKAVTPAKHNLFEVDDNQKVLSNEKADIFHHIVGKLLYVSKRARMDIDLTISFLCTRVAKSNDDDWMKLKRLLTYLKGSLGLGRIIRANDLNVLYAWVVASFAVHQDMRGHTGGVMSFGKGIIIHKSLKQKINTKSSTETELVGASEFLPWLLWSKRFLEMQGYHVKELIFYQDNESAIKMELNGQRSYSDRSRHIKFFFIKDVIDQENLDVR